MRPVISVLIPAFNEEELISKVIDSVHASFREAAGPPYEIIVCDNNSTDATAERAREKDARVVHEPHNQIARARNKAASHATGEWLIFLDADTLLSPELLKATLDCVGSNQICGGGSIIAFDGPALTGIAAAMVRFWNCISRRFDIAAGSYLFCAREAWEETGGFPESVYAGEELFFSRRIQRWGRKRRMRFTVLTDAPIVTSSRKLQWYGGPQLLWRTVKLAVPGALKNRDRCNLWYSRPPGVNASSRRD